MSVYIHEFEVLNEPVHEQPRAANVDPPPDARRPLMPSLRKLSEELKRQKERAARVRAH